jgi:predicted lysophospholipase L1 biosynthesis ABC-type transport system permease subunit
MAIFYLLLQKILLWNYEKFFKKVKNFYIFDAIRSTIKPGNVSFFILFSSIISFLSVFVFFVFSGSFVNYLNTLTQESRDMFLINVQQKDIKEFEKYFTQDEIYEIVTLRIAKINDVSLKEFL